MIEMFFKNHCDRLDRQIEDCMIKVTYFNFVNVDQIVAETRK